MLFAPPATPRKPNVASRRLSLNPQPQHPAQRGAALGRISLNPVPRRHISQKQKALNNTQNHTAMNNLIIERLKRKPIVAAMFRALYPDYSTCRCCGLPWNMTESHIVHYRTKPYMGFFAVCEYCWHHQPLEKIEEATRKLYYSRSKKGREERYLDEMLEETRKDYERTIARQHDSTNN